MSYVSFNQTGPGVWRENPVKSDVRKTRDQRSWGPAASALPHAWEVRDLPIRFSAQPAVWGHDVLQDMIISVGRRPVEYCPELHLCLRGDTEGNWVESSRLFALNPAWLEAPCPALVAEARHGLNEMMYVKHLIMMLIWKVANKQSIWVCFESLEHWTNTIFRNNREDCDSKTI